MLSIRLQRTGRSGHAQFRIIVQDSRFSPKRGRVAAYLGSYNPHTKTAVIDGEQAAKYLENGAQPSDRVAKLLQKEGIKLPEWVKLSDPKQRSVRNAEKRRSTAPAQPAQEVPAETAEPAAEDAPAAEETQPAEKSTEQPADGSSEAKPAEESKPAETETQEKPAQD